MLPHLDLLTTSQGGLTAEAREVIPLLYENPELVWLGFKDPSFPLPQVIENLFPHRISLLGIARNRLRHLVTQTESRKFGRAVQSVGAVQVRLRRQRRPAAQAAVARWRARTTRPTRAAPIASCARRRSAARSKCPTSTSTSDIGGYAKVKEQLRNEILDVLRAQGPADRRRRRSRGMEELIPKGMIFWGPPGTGKTLFAKAMAAAIGAAVTIVIGPGIEEQMGRRERGEPARRSSTRPGSRPRRSSSSTSWTRSPSARGTYTGSGVEHSMVNQLLTEMDGFHKEEMVFVVGTTNFVEILDPALLRPGRFEFHLHIPYPGRRRPPRDPADLRPEDGPEDDARRRWSTRSSAPATSATRRRPGTPFSGDHLNALCRAVARIRLREERTRRRPRRTTSSAP